MLIQRGRGGRGRRYLGEEAHGAGGVGVGPHGSRGVKDVVREAVEHRLPRELVGGAIGARRGDAPDHGGVGEHQREGVGRHEVELLCEVLAAVPPLPEDAAAGCDGLLDRELLGEGGVGHEAPYEGPAEFWRGAAGDGAGHAGPDVQAQEPDELRAAEEAH